MVEAQSVMEDEVVARLDDAFHSLEAYIPGDRRCALLRADAELKR